MTSKDGCARRPTPGSPAIGEALETYLSRRAITSPIAADDLAVVVSGLANGLAVEEMADPRLRPATRCWPGARADGLPARRENKEAR